MTQKSESKTKTRTNTETRAKTLSISAEKRHIMKTFTWRIIATLTTTLIAWVITGDPMVGLKVGSIEFIVKMLLYYMHEKAWHQVSIK
jgi:uncharacterized membrane protein